jgi:hypothetical protein
MHKNVSRSNVVRSDLGHKLACDARRARLSCKNNNPTIDIKKEVCL